MNALTTPRLGCQFDRFLYASVGEDNNGMPLTVLSALARMNVDPWEEAAKLTQLPKESAIRQLAGLLGGLRTASATILDPARIAAPLIALLPHPRDRVPPVLLASAQTMPTTHPAAVPILLTVLTYAIFMLLGQWLMGSLQPPGQTQASPSSATAIESPRTPPSGAALQEPVK